MKKNLLRTVLLGAVITGFSLASCSKDNNGGPNPDPVDPGERWITVAGALMQDAPGDGNGGTMVYSVSEDDARDPNVSIDVFENGMHVKSNRTARLQSSDDGNFLFNIQYTGADGGVFNKYSVDGGGQFTEADVAINTADYVGASPRWAKLHDDRTGIAVNVRTPANVSNDAGEYQYTRGEAVVLALDLQNVLISGVQEYEIPLSPEEEAQGYHIWRLDAPFLNRAGDRLFIGTWMRKWIPGTTTADADAARLNTKTVVVDYPSLQNPRVITSTVATGDNSGYRSPMSHLGTDGNIYQATHRELAGTGGSHILRIGQDNEYDNSYVFSLDAALGVTDSYIETWKYAGNGIGYVLYSLVVDGSRTGGYIARVDLNARTATRVDIPGNPNLSFGQYQGITVHGEEVYIAVAPVGQDGNIYIFNSGTGEVTQGARLVNKTGNQYIGIH